MIGVWLLRIIWIERKFELGKKKMKSFYIFFYEDLIKGYFGFI